MRENTGSQHQSKPLSNKTLVPLVQLDYVNSPNTVFEKKLQGHRAEESIIWPPPSISCHLDSQTEFSRYLVSRKPASRPSENSDWGNENSKDKYSEKARQRVTCEEVDESRRKFRRDYNKSFDARSSNKKNTKPSTSSGIREKQNIGSTAVSIQSSARIVQATKDNDSWTRDNPEDGEEEEYEEAEHYNNLTHKNYDEREMGYYYRDRSIEREVDISTYIKEQRRIIKKVSSGTKRSPQPERDTVYYEIKEFKKVPIVNNRERYRDREWGREREVVNNSIRRNPQVITQQTPKERLDQRLPTSNNASSPVSQQKSKLTLRRIIDGLSSYKTVDERTTTQDESERDRDRLRNRLKLCKSDNSLRTDLQSEITSVHKGNLEYHKPIENRLKRNTTHGTNLSANGYDDNAASGQVASQYSTGQEVQARESFRLRLHPRHESQPNIDPALNQSLTINYQDKERRSELPNRNRAALLENASRSNDQPKEKDSKSGEVLLIGSETPGNQKSLAELFKKKKAQTQKTEPLQPTSPSKSTKTKTFNQPISKSPNLNEDKPFANPVQGRTPSMDPGLSKQDLVKRRMAYGKQPPNLSRQRIERTTTNISQMDDSEFSTPLVSAANNVSLQKAKSAKMLQSVPTNRLGQGKQNSSPKPEVLERLARGIKPQIGKAEMHEITRRHMAKFSKLNNKASLEKHIAKKADLLARKDKVKDLDLRLRGKPQKPPKE